MLLKIEPVKSEEVPLLQKISYDTFYDTFRRHNTEEDMLLFLNSAFSLNALELELHEPYNYFFFAKAGNEIAGYLKLSTLTLPELSGEEVLEVARIYVVKEKMGAGVGKAMMEFAISFARQNNKKTIYLGVWEHNQRAISFYEAYGFEKFGDHVFMVGNDEQTDWWMKLKLS